MANKKFGPELYQGIQKSSMFLLQNSRPYLTYLLLEITCINNILQIICASKFLQ